MAPILALLAGLTLAPAPALPKDTGYFQQGVDYRIEARLDEQAETLHGRLRLRYANNSRQPIDTLWFHLHLNAFRPNSAWAQRELKFGERRFQDLGPNEHAFERLKKVEIGGAAITPVFPGAPDSTVVAFPLPRRLAPGDTIDVHIDWDARPSTVARRQGRRERHYDFAQWYPRIAVFDRGGWAVQPLLPQGEFYGEFGTYDVTLDLASDQVVGATAVPVEGDPGWRAAAADANQLKAIHNVYAPSTPEALGLLNGSAAAGRKRVRWHAENVHHFAWSTSPDYIYEGGRHGDVLIHVLYQPGDTAWDEGVAVKNTSEALSWLETIFGPYPYPQVTNVHRIEGGGTEFPMMVMNGSAGLGLILHEVGHIYAHGVLGNNEWREGWLDEGMTSFQTNWYYEEHGQPGAWKRTMEAAAKYEREHEIQPINLPAAEFNDFSMYGYATYTRPSIVLRMLRELVGRDTMRQALRDYALQHRFQHVTEADLETAVERASGRKLDWFFRQWIHGTSALDYSVASATTRKRGRGWETKVEVRRTGGAWMPVTLRVGDRAVRLDSKKDRQTVKVRTTTRPTEVVVDPDMVLLDLDWSNNRKTL